MGIAENFVAQLVEFWILTSVKTWNFHIFYLSSPEPVFQTFSRLLYIVLLCSNVDVGYFAEHFASFFPVAIEHCSATNISNVHWTTACEAW